MITLRLDARTAQFSAEGRALSPPLPIGPQALREAVLRHAPPTALELEHAIEAVEDAVMPLHRDWPGGDELLLVADAQLREQAGVAEEATLDRAALEDIFSAAAAIAQGRPAASQPGLALPEVVAMLVVVREVMHHLGFLRVRFSR
jgi:hypothetical protein